MKYNPGQPREPSVEAILNYVPPEGTTTVTFEHPDGTTEVWNVGDCLDARFLRGVVINTVGVPDIESKE